MPLTEAKKKVLEHLKTQGASTPKELADALGFTSVAARQHLQALLEEDWVREGRREASGRGRPATEWSLTARGHGLFPDRHGELTAALLDSARQVFGEEGIGHLLRHRTEAQVEQYRARLDAAGTDLASRVRALAELRSEEGYMAESRAKGPEGFLLIEHHCPICEAAKACAGLCATELEVFRRSLGESVTVERSRHLLRGDSRCAYRITPTVPESST